MEEGAMSKTLRLYGRLGEKFRKTRLLEFKNPIINKTVTNNEQGD